MLRRILPLLFCLPMLASAQSSAPLDPRTRVRNLVETVGKAIEAKDLEAIRQLFDFTDTPDSLAAAELEAWEKLMAVGQPVRDLTFTPAGGVVGGAGSLERDVDGVKYVPNLPIAGQLRVRIGNETIAQPVGLTPDLQLRLAGWKPADAGADAAVASALEHEVYSELAFQIDKVEKPRGAGEIDTSKDIVLASSVVDLSSMAPGKREHILGKLDPPRDAWKDLFAKPAGKIDAAQLNVEGKNVTVSPSGGHLVLSRVGFSKDGTLAVVMVTEPKGATMRIFRKSAIGWLPVRSYPLYLN